MRVKCYPTGCPSKSPTLQLGSPLKSYSIDCHEPAISKDSMQFCRLVSLLIFFN